MNILQLETKLQEITENLIKDEFIFDFLSAYEMPKQNITRLRKNSDVNTLSSNGELTIKNKKVFFKIVDDTATIDINEFVKTKKSMRFIILTDFITIKAVDTKLLTSLEIPLDELSKNSTYQIFLDK